MRGGGGEVDLVGNKHVLSCGGIFKGGGFGGERKKYKILKMKGCATTSLGLWARRSNC